MQQRQTDSICIRCESAGSSKPRLRTSDLSKATHNGLGGGDPNPGADAAPEEEVSETPVEASA